MTEGEYYENPFYLITLIGMFVGFIMLTNQPAEVDWIFRATWWEIWKPMIVMFGSLIIGIIGTKVFDRVTRGPAKKEGNEDYIKKIFRDVR